MDKSKMKEIRRHVRQTDLAEELRLHANPSDLAEQSTQPHCIGPDGVEHNMNEHSKGRREVLNELWTTDKILKDGYWFVKLTDVIKIIDDYVNKGGDCNE